MRSVTRGQVRAQSHFQGDGLTCVLSEESRRRTEEWKAQAFRSWLDDWPRRVNPRLTEAYEQKQRWIGRTIRLRDLRKA